VETATHRSWQRKNKSYDNFLTTAKTECYSPLILHGNDQISDANTREIGGCSCVIEFWRRSFWRLFSG
jgi:hypothetical protein